MPQKLTPEMVDAALAEVRREKLSHGPQGACTLFTPNEKTCIPGLTRHESGMMAGNMGVEFDWKPGPCE